MCISMCMCMFVGMCMIMSMCMCICMIEFYPLRTAALQSLDHDCPSLHDAKPPQRQSSPVVLYHARWTQSPPRPPLTFGGTSSGCHHSHNRRLNLTQLVVSACGMRRRSTPAFLGSAPTRQRSTACSSSPSWGSNASRETPVCVLSSGWAARTVGS